MENFGRDNEPKLHMTTIISLFGGGRNVVYKRDNLHVDDLIP